MEKHTNTHVPTIHMTASAMESFKTRCIAAGMDSHISKPVYPQELSSVLTSVLLPTSIQEKMITR